MLDLADIYSNQLSLTLIYFTPRYQANPDLRLITQCFGNLYLYMTYKSGDNNSTLLARFCLFEDLNNR